MKRTVIPLLGLLLSSCTLTFQPGSNASSSAAAATSPIVVPWSGSSPIQILPESQAITEMFSLDSTLSIQLSFTPESLSTLSEYGARDDRKWGDVYFPATATMNLNGESTSFEEVGVRMKGNWSRKEIVHENQITDLCNLKVSFKATFDDELYDLSQFTQFKHDWTNDSSGRKARKDRNYRGLEKLDLKFMPRNRGCNGQEIYVYRSFREQGILAPHANYCSLQITNGISTMDAVYEVIENIDKEFLKKNLGKEEAQGDLYKCTYGVMGKANLARDNAVTRDTDADGLTKGTRVEHGKIGVKNCYNLYFPSYDLKTNDSAGEGSDFSSMVNFINAMWNIRYKKQSQQYLESVLDVDEFLRFEALSYLFGNFDDQRNNANNYYIYFLPSNGKAIYIPYDWDWCLGLDEGRDVASYKPNRRTDLSGNAIDTNIYYNTIFSDSNEHAYSIDGYVSRYDSYIQSFVNAGVLEFANYQKMSDHAPEGYDSEESIVQSYMAKKKQTIASYYGK